MIVRINHHYLSFLLTHPYFVALHMILHDFDQLCAKCKCKCKSRQLFQVDEMFFLSKSITFRAGRIVCSIELGLGGAIVRKKITKSMREL